MKNKREIAARRGSATYRREEFRQWLLGSRLSYHTIESYLFAVDEFFGAARALSQVELRRFVERKMAQTSPKTVNNRISALNKYLEFSGKANWKLKALKVPKGYALDNVITNEDYEYLKKRLKKDGDMFWYFVVRFLAATGARVSEFLKFTAEGVRQGYVDLYGKGAKRRRIYIPERLRTDALEWLGDRRGALWFSPRTGKTLTREGIASGIKKRAIKYGIDVKCVHPHSFRHLFAKRFLAGCNDICFLADLMGHDSIETTRLYLRKSSAEQRAIVDDVVTW